MKKPYAPTMLLAILMATGALLAHPRFVKTLSVSTEAVKRSDRVRPDAHLAVDRNQAHRSIVGHPGVLNFNIRIEGPSVSVMTQDLMHDANLVELMARLVKSLVELEAQVRQALSEMCVDLRWPPPVVVVTEIQSKGWFSDVPEECLSRGFCSIPPPMSLEGYKTLFENFIQSNRKGGVLARVASTPRLGDS